jgi:CHAD domain-containing protein
MMRTSRTKTSGRRKPAYRRRKVSSTAASLDCATAFQRIARDCVARITARHSSACAGDAEAVHQIRVAITRLRAAVSFFAPMTVDAEWLRLKKEIAWLNVSLGAARDTDVVVEYSSRKRYRAWAHIMIGQNLDARQTRDHRRLVRCLRSPRFQRLIDDLSGWIRRGPWVVHWEQAAHRKPAQPLTASCKHALDRWHKRLVRKGRHLATMDASRRHRLRIRAKRLRYMLEVLTDIVPIYGRGEVRPIHRPAKRLQRTLGDLRDLERFSRSGPPPEAAEPSGHRPPGFRRQNKKLLEAAVVAYRSLKQARVPASLT